MAAITFVLLGVGFLVLAERSAAQAADSGEIVIGLQNDMVNMNTWDPATNSVWKAYQVAYRNFETLLNTDLNGVVYAWLADPARGATGPGFTIVSPTFGTDASTVDVYIRPGVTFTDGMPMTAQDVVFSYQVQGWGTYATFINEALWWEAPIWPHWTGGAARSHIGVEISPVGPDVVRFHLSKNYAVFFLSTLGVYIIPKHIWSTHINPAAPLNYSNNQPLTDSADRSMDFSFGATQFQATIGTGPWETVSWTRNQGSVIRVSPTYWAKDRADAGVTTGGVRYNFYPDHLRQIRFVIYSSLDVISLALQAGQIDTLIWSLLPGFLQQVRFNPAISVEQVTDSGMFYMAFNMRRQIWNDKDLRKAIGMAIDKDYIVNTLMGGFGIKGSVPHTIVAPQYINESAVPPAFNIEGAKTFLTRVGIVDRDGDGFREYKDGRPIRTSILTPPKDYDPVRADAGIMIANNLKKIGLNIDSAPTAFDTIVAKISLPPVDFDIYILGFLLGTLPEFHVKDFFHCDQDVNQNPAGGNSWGYCNPEIDARLDDALTTLDDTARIQKIKDLIGIVVDDLSVNVLYYRKNLNAFRNDRWVGWVNTPPQLYNYWSIAKLARPGTVDVGPAVGSLNVAMTAPERALAGGTVTVDVFASQTRNFAPAAGATVWLNRSFGGVQRASSQATTDTSGHARFSMPVPFIQGDLTVTATAWRPGFSGTTSKLMQINVRDPIPIKSLSLSTARPVIGVGDSTTVVAKVIDSLGGPVQGATVTIDTTLVFGTITPASATTNAQGQALFTYQARANASGFPNQHLVEILKANTTPVLSETIVPDVQTQSLLIWVENDEVPNWMIVDVEAVDLVLDPNLPTDSTTIGARVTDFTGAPQADVNVTPVLPSSESGLNMNVTVTPQWALTDASGLATFTVAKTATAVRGNVPIRFAVAGTAYQASDMAGLLLSDPLTQGYAALIDFTDRSITSSPAGSTTISATIWDQTGLPATNAAVIYQIAPGDVGLQAQFPFAFNYTSGEYMGEGLDLNYFDYGGSYGPSFESSAGQAAGYGADNALNDVEVLGYTTVDSCDDTTWPAGFQGWYAVNATGAMSQAIIPAPHKGDSGVQVRAFIGSLAAASRLRLNVTTCSSNPNTFFGWGVSGLQDGVWVHGVENADFMIDSGLVIQRAPVFSLGSLTTDTPLLSSTDRVARVTAQFYARDGAQAAGAQVFLLRGLGTAARNVGLTTDRAADARLYGTLTTNATGAVVWDVAEQYTITNARVPVSPFALSQPIFYSFLAADPAYAYGGRNQLFAGVFGEEYYLDQFLYAPLTKIPMEFVLGYAFFPRPALAYAAVQVDKMLVPESGSANATVTLTDGSGAPIAGATVWSGPVQTTTNATGVATIPFTASLGSSENLVVARTPEGFLVRAWYGIVASRPVLSYGTISVTPAAAGRVSTISVPVTNTLAVAGPATVTLLVGGQAVQSKVITIGASGTQTVTFDHVFADARSYDIAIGTQTATAAIPAPPTPEFLAAYGLGLGLLAVGLVVGAVVGIALARRRGKPPAPEAMTAGREGEEL